MRSSIRIKPCKSEGCLLPPKLGYAGYCGWNHLPDELKEKIGSKRKLQIKKQNAVKYASVKLRAAKYKENTELELWFRARREQMTGYCPECQRSTNKNNDKYYKWSICHIAPKGLVPSTATNYHNWIELCQDCHAEFDSTFEKASKMKCFHEAKKKFQLFKDIIPAEELRKVNPYLL